MRASKGKPTSANKSSVAKRSIGFNGHKTSLSLEDEFWNALKEIAGKRAIHLSDLVAEVDEQRGGGNLSSALRLFVLVLSKAPEKRWVKALEAMTPLILKRASASRPSGQWRDDDYNVLENGIVVGRIFKVPVAPPDRPWMWASGHNGDIKRAAHGYEPTREAAMAAFAKSPARK